MGHIAATVLDAADSRVYECLLPDDRGAACVAARLAELIHLPLIGTDNNPLAYGLVLKHGCAVDPQSNLGDLRLPSHPTFRLVPTLVACKETLSFSFDDPPTAGDKPTEVRILSENTLMNDVEIGLKSDVRINAGVHREIERFAGRGRQVECAGLLLGTASMEGRQRVIHIKAAVSATQAEGNRTSVTIGLAAWESMLQVRDKDYSHLDVLGWFHTHPGWGVFLSDADVFIHRNFFAHPDMVAYVLDPTAGRDGFFYWQNGRLTLCPNYGLVGAALAKRRRKGAFRRTVIALIVATLAYLGYAYLPVDRMLGFLREKPPARVEKREAPPKPVEIKVQVYALQRGDTLWRVCRRFYGRGELADALARYNSINESGMASMRPGREIRIPPKEWLEKGR
ncbi:MAG: Mov34/MPN/PAD-1 family protein [Armatimonadota bacterium]|nr:Mov34/MPN/PAD-1 family protein [bacterium]